VDDIQVKPFAGFFVVLVTRHEGTLWRMDGVCAAFITRCLGKRATLPRRRKGSRDGLTQPLSRRYDGFVERADRCQLRTSRRSVGRRSTGTGIRCERSRGCR
jgi:hypothetical protein